MVSVPSSYDWYHPRIRFACVPRSKLHISGDFEQKMRGLVESTAAKVGKPLPTDPGIVFVPVHEQQISNILQKFDDVSILDPEINVGALAQSSIRSATRFRSNRPLMYIKICVTGPSLSRTCLVLPSNWQWASRYLPLCEPSPTSLLTLDLDSPNKLFQNS